jgi:hypothetical protein
MSSTSRSARDARRGHRAVRGPRPAASEALANTGKTYWHWFKPPLDQSALY